MRLLCNGTYLDLKDGASVQFTHDNPLFAFDSVKCERTTQFKLPTTPTNDRVLALARVPAYAGTGMRRKFPAELQAGAVVKTGYLYVSAYDGKEYTAVFVSGELVGLQRLRDLGKLADLMTYTDTVRIGQDSSQPLVARQNDMRWANVYHARQSGLQLRPSINLAKIYDDIVAQYGLAAEALPEQAAHLWLVSTAKGVSGNFHIKCTYVVDSQPQATDPADPCNSLEFDETLFEYEDTIIGIAQLSSDGQDNMYFNVRQFKAKTDIQITLPNNWPSNMYIYDFSGQHNDSESGAYYGGRWFTAEFPWDEYTHITPQGEELKGRSVKILAGECFSFVNSDVFYSFRLPNVPSGWLYNIGFFLQDGFDSEYTLNVKSADGNTLLPGSICRLQDNLPDITFIELLKVFAAVSGRMLNYSEENGITFDTLDFGSWLIKEIHDLTKRGEVKRTFADYGQSNFIIYDSGEDVQVPIKALYSVDNDNLTSENDLQKIPFSEGAQDDNYPTWIYISSDTKKEVLGSDMGGPACLCRVVLPTNANLQALCDASTQLKISASQTLLAYNLIKPKNRLLVDGSLYVWTARNWQKGIANYTLARL